MPRHRLLLAPLAGAALCALPASATPAIPSMDVDIYSTATAQQVCATGSAHGVPAVTGAWTMNVVGARSDGSQVSFAAGAPGRTFPRTCYTVAKAGTPEGGFTVRLVYTGAGESDLPWSTVAVSVWGPAGDKNLGAGGT